MIGRYTPSGIGIFILVAGQIVCIPDAIVFVPDNKIYQRISFNEPSGKPQCDVVGIFILTQASEGMIADRPRVRTTDDYTPESEN